MLWRYLLSFIYVLSIVVAHDGVHTNHQNYSSEASVVPFLFGIGMYFLKIGYCEGTCFVFAVFHSFNRDLSCGVLLLVRYYGRLGCLNDNEVDSSALCKNLL